MSFSIIIPSRNPENLKRCIAAIRESGCSSRIIHIDDNDPPQMSQDPGPGYTTNIPGIKPFGFARNVNLGIKAAGRDDVIIMNDDALVVTSGRDMATVMNEGDYLIVEGGVDRLAFGHSPDVGLVSAAIRGASCIDDVRRRSPLDFTRTITSLMVPFVCVYIPRRTIDTVGLLEERFEGVYGGEDDDYCYRVRAAGLKLGVYDGCVVDHGALPSTFRPDGKGRDITETRKRFKEIHGFEMGTR